MKLSEFKFDLPVGHVALYPAENRDESRMMVIHKDTGKIEHKIFKANVDRVVRSRRRLHDLPLILPADPTHFSKIIRRIVGNTEVSEIIRLVAPDDRIPWISYPIDVACVRKQPDDPG